MILRSRSVSDDEIARCDRTFSMTSVVPPWLMSVGIGVVGMINSCFVFIIRNKTFFVNIQLNNTETQISVGFIIRHLPLHFVVFAIEH